MELGFFMMVAVALALVARLLAGGLIWLAVYVKTRWLV